MELNPNLIRRQRGPLTKKAVDLTGPSAVHSDTVARVIAEAREELGYHRSVQLDIRPPDAPMEPWEKMRRFT